MPDPHLLAEPGMPSATGGPAPTLVRADRARPAGWQWDGEAQQLLDGREGFVRVVGGPGTGKTSLLAEAAARRMLDDGPDRVLVLTSTRKAAEALRSQIARLLTHLSGEQASAPRAVREPMVRTVHSYAFGVLRAQAAEEGSPPPRLLSGPEQDAVVRELLAGDLADAMDGHDSYWPERLRPALTVPGFAEELRDLLMRAAERGLSPEDLVRLGRRKKRDEWVAAGTFWQQYEQVTRLRAAGGSALAVPPAAAYDAAELVTAALLSLMDDDKLLARERERIRHLFVDDAQHLAPLQWRLIRLIGTGAKQFVVAGDADQTVFSFRGAEPVEFVEADPDGKHTVTLRQGRRMARSVREAVARLAEAAPRPHRVPDVAPDQPDLGVAVRLFRSPAAEAAWVADQLRRAHLVDGIPWDEMAVVVRSPGRTFPVLQRALRWAGVPIASAADHLPLARNPAVRPLLTALRVVAHPEQLTPELADELLSSPLGGADPLALRRLRRGLRRLELTTGGDRSSDELLVQAIRDNDPLTALADSEAGPLRRLAAVLSAGRAAIDRKADVEQVLWDMWQASGLQQRWLRLSERGGSLGRQADAELDAVVALFHAAATYADRLPQEGVDGFADYLLSQRIAGDSLAPSAVTSAGVELTTAHGAAGREWTVVAVPAVQEGSWPDLRPRGSLLGVERLVDVLSGVDADTVSAIAPVLAEERRLFHVACSRARSRLLVSACAGDDEQPSRFIDELGVELVEVTSSAGQAVQRPLVLSRLVGELRAAVCDEQADPGRRRRAARQLARLAAARVPGAHPDSWYGLAEPSTDRPLAGPDEQLTVSPSTVDLLDRCPLRWLLERHGGTDPAQLAAVTGSLVHWLAQRAADGATVEQLRKELDTAWRKLDVGAPWFARRERERVHHMLDAFLEWLRRSRDQLTELAVEFDITVELPPAADGVQRVRIRGRVDRLEKDGSGRQVVVDIKTSKSPVSAQEAAEHTQLATYQLAVWLSGGEPGGGQLLYLAKPDKKTGAGKVVSQPPLDEQGRQEWLHRVRSAARAGVGPVYVARASTDCGRCPVRACCPLQPEGRQVPS
jgi:superfamily I DNA/RNA helicase/RecB family exonuclease